MKVPVFHPAEPVLCVHLAVTKWPTHYFRYVVNIANPSAYTNFTFNVERDDGFVLYVNGVEQQRNNMPASPTAITYTTSASTAVDDAIISSMWLLLHLYPATILSLLKCTRILWQQDFQTAPIFHLTCNCWQMILIFLPMSQGDPICR